MKTILAPLDFSEASDAVVAEAAALARAVGGRVVMLTVIQSPALTVEFMPGFGNATDIVAASERYVSARMAAYATQLARENIATETRALHGAPVELITAQAKALGASYIVMGSHGHTAIYDLLVGSTTHGVLLRAQCPVLIIPTPNQPAAKKSAKEELAGV
jgi:nucleotide-binding universal stress UspA family protein